jgi:hypothetical protein
MPDFELRHPRLLSPACVQLGSHTVTLSRDGSGPRFSGPSLERSSLAIHTMGSVYVQTRRTCKASFA